MYVQRSNGAEVLLTGSGGSEELEVRRFWSELGVDMERDSEL
jgi:hypothetical protein